MRLAAASLLLSAAAAWPDCAAYYGNATSAPARWCREGGYFMFRSPTGNNNGSAIPLFYHCSGDPASARVPVLFAHGYPTSSFDLAGVVAALARELDARELSVCAVDMAGFGFSAKPRAPWTYSIFDHAAALADFATRASCRTRGSRCGRTTRATRSRCGCFRSGSTRRPPRGRSPSRTTS